MGGLCVVRWLLPTAAGPGRRRRRAYYFSTHGSATALMRGKKGVVGRARQSPPFPCFRPACFVCVYTFVLPVMHASSVYYNSSTFLTRRLHLWNRIAPARQSQST